MDVELSGDGRISLAGTPYLAGAGLLQDRGVGFLMESTGCSLTEAINSVTETPGRLIGMSAGETALNEGSPGDVVAFHRCRGFRKPGDRSGLAGWCSPGNTQIVQHRLQAPPVIDEIGLPGLLRRLYPRIMVDNRHVGLD